MSDATMAPLFSDSERRLLRAVLDEIIPARTDGSAPAAGALGMVVDIERAASTSPELHVGIAQGLAALDDLARSTTGQGFEAAPAAARRGLLDTLSASSPGFVPGIVYYAYGAYYQHPRVLEALGIEARPPHPKGYEVAPSDLDALLEEVRRRGRIYREG
jgi:hypothetical protein